MEYCTISENSTSFENDSVLYSLGELCVCVANANNCSSYDGKLFVEELSDFVVLITYSALQLYPAPFTLHTHTLNTYCMVV